MKLFRLILFSTFLLYISCGVSTYNSNDNLNDTTKKLNSVSDFEIIVYSKYEIPLNVDLYNFLYENEIKYQEAALSLINMKESYISDISRAINLGIYTSDLAYSTIYSYSQNSLNYFEASRYLANELGFNTGFDEFYFTRLENNASNHDSIKFIAEESYWKACNFLDEQNKNNILPFVVYGGWIETLYLMVIADNELNDNQIIKNQIFNQKSTLKNVIKYLYDVMIESSAYYYNNDLKGLIEELKIIEKLYNDLEEKNSQKLYNKLKSKIVEIRKDKVELI